MSTSIINHLTWFQDINLAAAKSTLISRNQVYLQCILPPRVHLQWLIHSQGAVMHMPVNKPNVNCTYDSSHGTDEIYPKGPPHIYIYIYTYIILGKGLLLSLFFFRDFYGALLVLTITVTRRYTNMYIYIYCIYIYYMIFMLLYNLYTIYISRCLMRPLPLPSECLVPTWWRPGNARKDSSEVERPHRCSAEGDFQLDLEGMNSSNLLNGF